MTAPAYPWPDYADSAHKLLSDNRDRYIAQSAATRNGVVAPLPARPRIPASAIPADVGAGQLDHHMPAKAGEGIDPFDKYARTPIPIYRDGREYERDAMQDERR